MILEWREYMREEITLRELVEIIFEKKKLICIITAVAILVSGIYSFFILDPEYSASAVLLTNPIESDQNVHTDGIDDMISSLSVYPNMTIETYKEQVINSTVLSNTINELQLTNSDGKLILWDELVDAVSVEIVNKTNLLKITVKDKNPEQAAKIANSLANNFIKYISGNAKKFGEQTTSILEELLEEEERKLEEESKKLREYLANSHNIEQLKLEISSLYDKINSYSMSLINVEKQIETDTATLKVLLGDKKTISGINLDSDIKLDIPLNSGDSDQKIEINIDSSNKLQNALLTIKATELETRLIQNQAEKKSLEDKIKELEKRLKDTQTLLAEEEYKYNTIQRNYRLAEQTYNAYLERHKEAVLAASSNIGETAIIISTSATIPLKPSSHGKLFYLAIGSCAGFIISVGIALLMGYWKKTEPKGKVIK